MLGWLLWLAGAHTYAALAAAGAFTASLGLALQFGRFWQLWWRSPAPDRVHATVVAVGGTLGTLCAASLGVAVWLDAGPVALALVHTALWGLSSSPPTWPWRTA